MKQIKHFKADEAGATAIEYGLLAAMIALACIGAFVLAGEGLSEVFAYVADKAVPVYIENS